VHDVILLARFPSAGAGGSFGVASAALPAVAGHGRPVDRRQRGDGLGPTIGLDHAGAELAGWAGPCERIDGGLVGARGVLFAITDEDRDMLAGLTDEDERVDYVGEVIEERWEKAFVAETDKAWDAMHRCLTDGSLGFDNGTFPLNRCILGGELLTSGEDYLIILTDAQEVPAVSVALDGVTRDWFGEAYGRIDRDSYGPEYGPDDLEYTWGWFQGVRDLWRRAAADGRSVVFTVDQ
jgi:hypothetical protein